jgi:hypothetical protein
MAFSGDPEGLREVIAELEKRFGLSDISTDGKAVPTLYERIAWRMRQFHNLPEADPPLNDEWKDAQKFQSDAPRRLYESLLARGTENHYTVGVRGLRDSATERTRANKVETVLNSGLLFTEERSNIDVQADLLRGLITQCYGVLHWCKAEHLMPPVPEPEYLEEMPDDPAEAKRYEQTNEAESAVDEAERIVGTKGKKDKRPQAKYREKDTAREERYKSERALAGFPWWVESIDPSSFAFAEDRSLLNGMSRCMVVRDMSISDYVERLRSERKDEDIRSLSEATKGKLPEFGEREAPASWEPTSGEFGKRIRVWQLWTRNEFYECVGPITEHNTGVESAEHGNFRCVKAFKHPYGMPPFSLATWIEAPGAEPALRYKPMLEGIYLQKPIFDRAITLFMVMAESAAIPYYYWKNTETNEPWQDEQGNTVKFAPNTAGQVVAPPGYELVQVKNDVGESYVKGLEFLKAEYEDAEPPAGPVEASATSQPWNLRIQQQQQSMWIAAALRSVAKAIVQMARSMVSVMSMEAEDGGFSAPICVFKRGKEGEVDYSEVVSVEAKDVRSLDVYATIDAISSAERITLVEHGVALLSQGIITKADFYENYLGKGDPDQYIASKDEEQMFEEYIKPGLVQQELALRYGDQIVLGPDGQFVGPDGAMMAPTDVLAANGLPPEVIQGLIAQFAPQQMMQPPMPMGAPGMMQAPPMMAPPPQQMGGMVPGVSPQPQGVGIGSMGQTTGALPALPPPPGTIPLGGMVG